MDDNELHHALELVKEVGGFSELYHVTTFKGVRAASGGLDVTLEIWDAGPGNSQRYLVVACDEEGREASGNPDSDLRIALMQVHWYDLDPSREQ